MQSCTEQVDVAALCFPQAAAAGVVLWSEGRVLVGWSPEHGEWSEPGGARKAEEAIQACAARELFENTRLVAKDLDIDWQRPSWVEQYKYVL